MSGRKAIRKVGVIGAGVMGAGIAAQAANGGAEVVLLDIVPSDGDDRSARACGALDRLIRAGSSGGLMHPSIASRIQIGNVEDDFGLLAECDWIVEVVVELLDVKQNLYHRISQIRRADAVVSSNTSTIPLARLVDGLPDDFRRHFVIAHFFNPPRHMRLVELVAGDETSPSVIERITDFIDRCMGKTVIRCADRPGFIANRLGIFWMQLSVREAVTQGLTVEAADAIMRVCGFPTTGVFGLWDLVGIDLMELAVGSLGALLPSEDDFGPLAEVSATVRGMLDKGYKGRKGSTLQGFYRQFKDAEGRMVREVIELDTLEYRAPRDVALASAALKPGQIAELLACEDVGGRYAWKILSHMLHYATRLIPEVATEAADFDQAMKLGYNWTWGPFELLDRIGVPIFVERLAKDRIAPSPFLQQAVGRPVYRWGNAVRYMLGASGTYQPIRSTEGVLCLTDIKGGAPVRQYSRCALWDLGDGVWCLEFTARVPTLDLDLLDQISRILDEAITADKALVIYNERPVFAAGADLKQVMNLIGRQDEVEHFIHTGQTLFTRIQNAPIPVVGAPRGSALAGGLELLLHCHAIQAYAEAAMGLVEIQVGIVPGWGGCRELLLRSARRVGAEHAIAHCFKLLRTCKVTASAHEARELGILRECDEISMNPDRLMFDAKQKALELRRHSKSNEGIPTMVAPTDLVVTSIGYQRELEDALLQLLLKSTESGWHSAFLDEERKLDLALFARGETRARIEHLLATGKSLKN